MGIGINTQNPDEGELKRDLEEIACGVWFTSTGAVMPKLVKYQDEEGLLHTISQIRVLTQDKKFYCGIPIQEYRCSTVVENQLGRNVALRVKGEKLCVDGIMWMMKPPGKLKNWYGIWTGG